LGHVYKIVSGAGNHSVGGISILKINTKKYLEDEGYDFFVFEQYGVFLIRMEIEK